MSESPAADLRPDLRSLLRDLLERLDMGSGEWRLEVVARDGEPRHVYRHHERVEPDELDHRFPPKS